MAVRLALDTNRYTDLCRGVAEVVATVEQADEVWLPFVVLGELRAGFAVGTQGVRNEAVMIGEDRPCLQLPSEYLG